VGRVRRAARRGGGGRAPRRHPLPAAATLRQPGPTAAVAGRLGHVAFHDGGATVTPLAGFSLQARILGREDYSLGNESRFSPTDLALGWGPMATEGMAERLGVTQGSRWYRYRWGSEGPPLPPATIARNSANMHLVPADAAVAAAIGRTRDGQVVRLQGWLIRIDDPSGWHWQSSLSREDTGAGACELVLVCAID
jgi:hypothetical protein